MPASYKIRRKVTWQLRRRPIMRPSHERIIRSALMLAISIMLIFRTECALAAAKMDKQLKLFINDNDGLQMAPAKHAQVLATETHSNANEPDEHPNLYRSELKRLSYETMHRILRDENEPIYRRENAEKTRFYRKPSQLETHKVVRRAAPVVQERVEERDRISPPPQHTLKLNNAQLLEFVASRDYEGDGGAIYTLDLSNNHLKAVNLSAFTSLQRVELANNSLTTIPLNERDGVASTVTTLNLNDNQIEQAMALSSISLRELHLSGNRITQLSHLNLSMLSSLETLDLSCNRIAELETAFFPQRMHNLKHLNLAYNRIGTIYRETFYNLLSLNILLLSHNNISDIDYETFLALPNLQYLDLSNNQLRGEAIRALQGIPDLVRLSIAYNPEVGAAMQEFVASWSLKELDASGTGLCQIPAALAQSVRMLKLSDNWLKIINCGDLDSYPLLQYLDLSHSRIEDIEDDALGRLEILETLFLDHNQLHKIPLSLPTSLVHLFLQYNQIMDIHEQSFQGLNNLQTLDLSGNKLLYLPALPLPKLLTLNLRAADLRGVSQALVHTLPRLRDLLLEENPIKCSDLLSIAEWASPCRILERNGSERDNSNSNNNNNNNTEWESLNIEGNSIMVGDLGEEEEQGQQVQAQPKQQQYNDNRIGFANRAAVEQIIAMSADKLGQQQAQAVQKTGDRFVDEEDKETASNEFKAKFVRMHNFFEKFRSNCGERRRRRRRGVDKSPSSLQPTCATELEPNSSSSEQRERDVDAANAKTKDVEDKEVNNRNEKSNGSATQVPSGKKPQEVQKQQYMNTENMSPNGEKHNKDNAARQNKLKGASGGSTKYVERANELSAADAKLFIKFNQKNFTTKIVESSGATNAKTMRMNKITEMATKKSTPTTHAKLRTEAEAFDYKANASEALTATTTKMDSGAAERATTTREINTTTTKIAKTIKASHSQLTPTQTTESQMANKSTPAAEPQTVVAKTLWQVLAAETGTQMPTAANLLVQHIIDTETATTTTPITVKVQEIGREYAEATLDGKAVRKSIAKTKEITKTPTTEMATTNTTSKTTTEIQTKTSEIPTINVLQASAPKSILLQTAKDTDGEISAQQQLQPPPANQPQQYEPTEGLRKRNYDVEAEKTTTTTPVTKATANSLNAIPTVTSSLNNAKEISARQPEQQQQQATENLLAVTEGKKATKTTPTTTTSADDGTLLQIAKSDSAAVDMQQQEFAISPMSNFNITIEKEEAAKRTKILGEAAATITATTTPTIDTSINSKTLSLTAHFMQMNGAKNAKILPLTTSATFDVAATMFSNKSEATLGLWSARALKVEEVESDFMVEKVAREGRNGIVETTTTTYSHDTPTTTNDIPASLQTLDEKRIDNKTLTRNDSDNDCHKTAVKNEKDEEEKVKEKEKEKEKEEANEEEQQNTSQPKQTHFWQQHNFKRANSYTNENSGHFGPTDVETEDEPRAEAIMATTATKTTHLPHKHEPLQLHVRDRHLIGTPLLMHRGENVLVDATEMLRHSGATTTTTKTTTAAMREEEKQTTTTNTTASAMNANTLAKGQPTEANYYRTETVKHAVVVAEKSAEVGLNIHKISKNNNNNNDNSNNDNSPKPKRPEAEAMNIEMNVTPEQQAKKKQKQYASEADKQMLAGKEEADTINQTTTTSVTEIPTDIVPTVTAININSEQHKRTRTNATKKYGEIAGSGSGGSGFGGSRRKPSLIMKKMTIQTKHAAQPQPTRQMHYTLNTPRENEALLRVRYKDAEQEEEAAATATAAAREAYASGKHLSIQNSIEHAWQTNAAEYDAKHVVLPLGASTAPKQQPQHKHSTVNTPITRRSHKRLLSAIHNAHLAADADGDAAAEHKLDAPTAQHSISNQQRERAHTQEEGGGAATHTQTQKWLDVRKASTTSDPAHSGLIPLVLSCTLFFVLLIGLMHVYRCDVLPWRRHLLTAHQQRPHHQLQFNVGADDDAHSFLHYHNNNNNNNNNSNSGGQQQHQQSHQQQLTAAPPPLWHHSARAHAPYSSPLHNLHVRELQKTSAVELEAQTRVTRSHYDIRPHTSDGVSLAARPNDSITSNGGGSGTASRNSSSSLSSTRSSSTMADNDSFYVEMVAECGHMAGCGSVSEALHSDILPMELLAVTSSSSSTYKRDMEKDSAAPAAAVQETVSQRLASEGPQYVEETHSVGSKRKAKARDNKSKKLTSSGAVYNSSSSTRKFDLW